MINLTLEESIRLEDKEAVFKIVSDVHYLNEVEKLKKELKNYERSEELAWEQVSFARDLLDQLEEELDRVKSAKQAKEAFIRILENGYFER